MGRDHFGKHGIWNYGVKMDLKYMGHRNIDSIRLAPYRDYWLALVKSVMNVPLAQKARNY